MRENILRWFCHVQRKMINVPMRKSELIQVEVAERKRKTKDNINKRSRKKACQLRSLRRLILPFFTGFKEAHSSIFPMTISPIFCSLTIH